MFNKSTIVIESVWVTDKQSEIISESTIKTKAMENQIDEESQTELTHKYYMI